MTTRVVLLSLQITSALAQYYNESYLLPKILCAQITEFFAIVEVVPEVSIFRLLPSLLTEILDGFVEKKT